MKTTMRDTHHGMKWCVLTALEHSCRTVNSPQAVPIDSWEMMTCLGVLFCKRSVLANLMIQTRSYFLQSHQAVGNNMILSSKHNKYAPRWGSLDELRGGYNPESGWKGSVGTKLTIPCLSVRPQAYQAHSMKQPFNDTFSAAEVLSNTY